MERQDDNELFVFLDDNKQNALASSSRYQTIAQMKQNIEALEYEAESAEREVTKDRPYVRKKLSFDVQLNNMSKETTRFDDHSKISRPTLNNTKLEQLISTNEPVREDKTTYCRPINKSHKKQIVISTVENRSKLQKLVKLLAEARRKEKQKNAWDSYIWQLRLKHRMSESDCETQESLRKSFTQSSLPEKLYEKLYSTIFKTKPTVDFQVLPPVPSYEFLHKMTQQRRIASVTRQNFHEVKTPISKSKNQVSETIQHICSPVISWKNYIHTTLDTWEPCEEDKIVSSESEFPESVQSLSLLSVSLSAEKTNNVKVEKIGDHTRTEPDKEIQESSHKSTSWKSVESDNNTQYKFTNKIPHDIEKRDSGKKIWLDNKRSEIKSNTQTLKKVQKTESLDTKVELEKKDKNDLVKKRCHEPRRLLSNKKTYHYKKQHVYDKTRSTDLYSSDSWSTRVQKPAQEPESSDITELTEKAETIDDNLKSESEGAMFTPASEVSNSREPSIRIKSSNKTPRDYDSVRSSCSTNEKRHSKVHLSKVEKQDEEDKLLCCRRRIQELLEQAYQGLVDKVNYSKDSFSETVKKEDGEIVISCKIRKPIKKIVRESQKETPDIMWPNIKDDKKQYIERIFLLHESLERMRPEPGEESAETLPNASSFQSTTTQNHPSKIFQEKQFESKHTETERLNEEYCYCKLKLWHNSSGIQQKISPNEISKTPQCFSTIYETNEDDTKETKSNTCCSHKNQQQKLANGVKNSSHNIIKQPVQQQVQCNVNTIDKISSAIQMKMDEKAFQSLLSECVQTDDKIHHFEEIFEEEINKSKRTKRDIVEILGEDSSLSQNSEYIVCCMDMPTKDCGTKTTASLGACCQPSPCETRGSCSGTTESPLEIHPVEEQTLTIAVNTDPLSFLTLFELSKEAASRLLSQARFTCTKIFPIPSPLASRFPMSSYRLTVRNSDPVPQLTSIQAWRRQQAELNLSSTTHSLPSYDCCVCRHLLERKQKRPVGVFTCRYCGKGFIRAYCRDLHEQKCARDCGSKAELALNLAILK